MTRRIVQKAIIKTIQRQIVEYTCDGCGDICGTLANPKRTWYGNGTTFHYCIKRCGGSRTRDED